MCYCTYCGIFFQTVGQLERHVFTHAEVKPFKCLTCYMSFDKRELLQRHYYRCHGVFNDTAPVHNLKLKEEARPLACNHCAQAKAKCNRKFPCNRCSARGIVCTLRTERRRGRPSKHGSTEGNDHIRNSTESRISPFSLDEPLLPQQDSNVEFKHVERGQDFNSAGMFPMDFDFDTPVFFGAQTWANFSPLGDPSLDVVYNLSEAEVSDASPRDYFTPISDIESGSAFV